MGVNKPLDGLALAALDTAAQIQRIAAIWCREVGDVVPSSRGYLVRWVKRDYGPILDKEMIEPLSVVLLDTIKQQIRVRARRKAIRDIVDPMDKRDYDSRVGRLLQSALGPARSWVKRTRITADFDGDFHYISAKVDSGLVAGLIPVEMKLRRIVNPSLLVYRHTGHEPMSYWVPGRIREVDDAFVWAVPADVQNLLQEFQDQGAEVELDYEAQACRVVTPFGSKLIPWRGLHPECED